MSASLNPHKRNLLFAGDGDDPKDPRLHKGQRMRLYNAHSYTRHLLSEILYPLRLRDFVEEGRERVGKRRSWWLQGNSVS